MKRSSFAIGIGLLVCTLLQSHIALAQQDTLSLRETLELVLENNPQLRVYQIRNESLAGEAESAALKPALEFNVEVENVLGTGDLNWFQGTEWTLSLSRVIERGNKLESRGNIVRRRQAMLDAERQITELDLLSKVARAFIELAAASARYDVITQAQSLAESTLENVAVRVDAGRSPEAELLRAAGSLAQAELTTQMAANAIDVSRQSLSAYWGDFNPETFTTAADLFRLEPAPPVESLLERMLQSPAITIFTAESRLREAELALVSAQRYSDFSVGAGIKHLAELDDTAFVAEFRMPLNSSNRASGGITTAQANLLRVAAEEEYATWRMQGQLMALDQQYRGMITKHNTLSESVIPLLEETLDSTLSAYESGLFDFTEVSTAQRDLLNAELEQIDAALLAHQLRIEIERLSGQLNDNTFPIAGAIQ